MPNYKQAGRLMQFTSVLGPDKLLIDTFEGVEGLSRLFDFQAELMGDVDDPIDPSDIVGTKVTIAIALVDVQGTRYVNGLVAAFEQTSGGADFDVVPGPHRAVALAVDTLRELQGVSEPDAHGYREGCHQSVWAEPFR